MSRLAVEAGSMKGREGWSQNDHGYQEFSAGLVQG
jgi:hypothetical protein